MICVIVAMKVDKKVEEVRKKKGIQTGLSLKLRWEGNVIGRLDCGWVLLLCLLLLAWLLWTREQKLEARLMGHCLND